MWRDQATANQARRAQQAIYRGKNVGIARVEQEWNTSGSEIAHRRSVMTIADREGLEHSSNGTYGAPMVTVVSLD